MKPRGTIAVRGTGSIGMRHLAILRDLRGVSVVAVPVRRERERDLQASGYETWRTLRQPAGEGPRGCIVATDTERHVRDLRDALVNGFSVLVEKPLSHRVKRLAALKKVAERKRLKIFVGCNLRFSKSLARFRQLLPKIGAVRSVRIECQSYLPDWRPQRDYRECYSARNNTGGVLLDLVHEIDYALWLFGRPKKVFARLENSGRLEIEAEDSADLLWVSPSGTAVSLRLDYVTPGWRRQMMAVGERGTLQWDAIAGTVRLSTHDGREQGFEIAEESDSMYRRQTDTFLRALSKGDAGELATFEEGAVAVAVCDAARRSARSGREEAVRDWRKA